MRQAKSAMLRAGMIVGDSASKKTNNSGNHMIQSNQMQPRGNNSDLSLSQGMVQTTEDAVRSS